MENYLFKNDVFTIKNYDTQKTFSSFLPGIAGTKGIPIWSFYCNRGQAISSFGIENKDNPILEFFPANTSYQYVSTYGFRSFIKVDGKVYEPFGVKKARNIERNMFVEFSQVKIEEINKELGFKYTVTYFVIPNENFGGLARCVNIENISDKALSFELIDGQATLLPFGVTNSVYKEMSNLMRSWMDVFNLENNLPFFKMRASTNDSAEITEVVSGNFYLSYNDKGELLKPIIDASLVFGYDTSLSYPVCFEDESIDEILSKEQVTVNKVPCAFSTAKVTLDKGENYNISTIIGQSSNLDELKSTYSNYTNKEYLEDKRVQSKNIVLDILSSVETNSNSEVFDSYIKQCYLDNVLRGGFPVVFGDDEQSENRKVHYIYSRKHGDPERDYNFFNISPEFYSQGNGNFRDVNQNRRSDVLLNPKVADTSIKLFYSLIQLDGYNPLEVRGYTYSIDKDKLTELKTKYSFIDTELEKLLSKSFTVGKVSEKVTALGLTVDEENKFLNELLGLSEQNFEAKYGEGYWSDHFTYNQDLLDNYLLVYPDKERDLLFNDKTYKVYESAEVVLPRKDKYVVTQDKKVRQYNSLKLDKERISKLGLDVNGTNWLKTNKGKDVEYTTNLFSKMLLLVVTKFLNLDPSGIGIEMEANKPGWNDAMNGLPGLIGSGVSETIELKRVISYLKEVVRTYKEEVASLKVLEELNVVLVQIHHILNTESDDLTYWKKANDVKEEYREAIRLGIMCTEKEVDVKLLENLITLMLDKVEDGIRKANELGEGIIPTFIYHNASSYKTTNDGLEIESFKVEKLPYFLEAPARYIKVSDDINEVSTLYKNVKATEIYDSKLKMYKTSESIEECKNEIGRIRAFTPGWQERESIFLHMTYKYMLGLLKSGLYDEFFDEVSTNLICFRDMEEYGRNPIENSSFIVSSVNPDKNIHGQGLVARLSGSTAEMLSIWNIMMVGKEWFTFDEGLTFKLQPIIPYWLFKDNKLSFTLFSKTKVTYINESQKSTFENDVKVYKYLVDGVEVNSTEIKGLLAEKIRNQEVKEILAYLK